MSKGKENKKHNTGSPIRATRAFLLWYNIRIQAKINTYIQKTNSKEQKIEWLDKFFRRMSTSLYKGSPPAPLSFVLSKTAIRLIFFGYESTLLIEEQQPVQHLIHRDSFHRLFARIKSSQ